VRAGKDWRGIRDRHERGIVADRTQSQSRSHSCRRRVIAGKRDAVRLESGGEMLGAIRRAEVVFPLRGRRNPIIGGLVGGERVGKEGRDSGGQRVSCRFSTRGERGRGWRPAGIGVEAVRDEQEQRGE